MVSITRTAAPYPRSHLFVADSWSEAFFFFLYDIADNPVLLDNNQPRFFDRPIAALLFYLQKRFYCSLPFFGLTP